MKDFTEKLIQYRKERDWRNDYPGDLAKSVAIEAGELLELFQWEHKTAEEIKADPELMKKIYKELPDTIIYAWQMAIKLGFDVEQMLNDKLEYVKKKYPAELIKGHEIDPVRAANYRKLKEEHRKNEKE